MLDIEIEDIFEDIEPPQLVKDHATTALDNIGKIVDMGKLTDWCRKNQVIAVFFGSRVALQETQGSDLDIMINVENYPAFSEDNYVFEQRQLLNGLYGSFLSVVKDHRIPLDFKLNLGMDDYYHGITYGCKDTNSLDNDFVFHYTEVPFRLEVSGKGMIFKVASEEDLPYQAH